MTNSGPPYPHRHGIGVTRREFLQVGYSGLMGIGLEAAFASRTAGAEPAKRSKSVILVFLTGGPSHFETFDPKPEAPAEIRGEFGVVPTGVAGVRFSEYLPLLAKQMKRLAVVRSMAHVNNGHLPATHWVLTGYPMPGIPVDAGADKPGSRQDWPSYTSALSQLRPRTDGIPSGVNLPTYLQEGSLMWPGQHAGMLGAIHDPWQIRSDPNSPKFSVAELKAPDGFAVERFKSRQALLEKMNARQDGLSALAETVTLTEQQRLAFTMLSSSGFRRAFDLNEEPDALRDRYGRHMFGQSLLLSRRLVEAGVPIIQANMGRVQAWDTHSENFSTMKDKLLPPLDQAVSTLLDDLNERGLVDDTLVVVVGEFGRSPKVATPADRRTPGREHWAQAFSAVFSGGGVRGGQVIGATDAEGGAPSTQAFSPDDLGATIYRHLGLSPDAHVIDREGRPIRLCHGTYIRPLYTGEGV